MRLVIAVLAVFLVATTAAASSPAHFMTNLAEPVVTDGARHAVYSEQPGMLTILDTREGSHRRIALPTACHVEDGKHGDFLLECDPETGFGVPYVLNGRRGTLMAVPGRNQTWFPLADRFSRIGSRWLEGTDASGHSGIEYLNWRTGQVRQFGEADSDPVVPRDLDSAGLDPLGLAGSYGVFERSGRYTLLGHIGGPLLLRRSGGRTITLDRCQPGSCLFASIGARAVAWMSDEVHVYMLRTRRRESFRFNLPVFAQLHAVQQTASTLFLSEPRTSNPADGVSVLTARLPRNR